MKNSISIALVALLATPLVAAQSGGQTGGKGGQGTGSQGSGPGQTGGKTSQGQTAPRTDAHSGLMLSTQEHVVGAEVKNAAGEKIGKVEEIVIFSDGSSPYVLVDLNDEAGAGSDYVLVPIASLRATGTDDKRDYTWSLDKERIKTAPGFQKDEWPKTGDLARFDEADKFYRNDPSMSGHPINASARTSSTSVMRSSNLKGKNIESPTGDKIGDVKDVVIDTASGRITYVVVSVGGFLGMGDRLVAVPWQAINMSSDKDGKEKFVLNTTKEQLGKAPEFKSGKDSWRDMSDPVYVERVYTFYSVRPYWDSKPSSTPTPPNQPPKGG